MEIKLSRMELIRWNLTSSVADIKRWDDSQLREWGVPEEVTLVDSEAQAFMELYAREVLDFTPHYPRGPS